MNYIGQAYTELTTAGISTVGGVISSILGLQTAKVNAKTQTDVALIEAQIASLMQQSGVTQAQVNAASEATKNKTMMYLGIGALALGGVLVTALMMRG